MELDEALRSRRSIRKFSDRKVERKQILGLIEKAVLAPTASNLQAWRFCVIDDPELVKRVDLFSPGLSGKPPVILAVCSDYAYAEKKTSGSSYKKYGCIMDASMAAENFMPARSGTDQIVFFNTWEEASDE